MIHFNVNDAISHLSSSATDLRPSFRLLILKCIRVMLIKLPSTFFSAQPIICPLSNKLVKQIMKSANDDHFFP